MLLGLVVANANIDEIIELIKSSKDSKEAKLKLIKKKWKLSQKIINFIKLVDDHNSQLKNNTYFINRKSSKSYFRIKTSSS